MKSGETLFGHSQNGSCRVFASALLGCFFASNCLTAKVLQKAEPPAEREVYRAVKFSGIKRCMQKYFLEIEYQKQSDPTVSALGYSLFPVRRIERARNSFSNLDALPTVENMREASTCQEVESQVREINPNTIPLPMFGQIIEHKLSSDSQKPLESLNITPYYFSSTPVVNAQINNVGDMIRLEHADKKIAYLKIRFGPVVHEIFLGGTDLRTPEAIAERYFKNATQLKVRSETFASGVLLILHGKALWIEPKGLDEKTYWIPRGIPHLSKDGAKPPTEPGWYWLLVPAVAADVTLSPLYLILYPFSRLTPLG